MKKILLTVLILLAITQSSDAQVFVGSGFAGVSFFGPSALDDGAGFTLQLEKDVALSKSGRLKIHPNINISFLYSNADRQSFPNYLNAISLSPKISYEIVSKEKWKIAPFANPFASYLIGLESVNVDFLNISSPIDIFKWGIEGGLRVDFIIKKTTIRFIPVSAQRSLEDFYGQGMISFLVSI